MALLGVLPVLLFVLAVFIDGVLSGICNSDQYIAPASCNLDLPVHCRPIQRNPRYEFISVLNKNLYIYKVAVNRKTAQDWCEGKGMSFASLKTPELLQIVAKELFRRKGTNEWFWLSASDAGQVKPGDYFWPDGTQVDAAMWEQGQPAHFGSGRETSAYFYTNKGKLLDSGSLTGLAFILCEVPESLITCF